jgi:hypothetical protein
MGMTMFNPCAGPSARVGAGESGGSGGARSQGGRVGNDRRPGDNLEHRGLPAFQVKGPHEACPSPAVSIGAPRVRLVLGPES